jgi:transcriptional regulator with XRE-family HTH domain
MDNKKIGQFIANLRKSKNLTQKELADKLFISDKAVSKWERGLAMPDIGLIEKLASCLGVNVSEILKGEKIEEMTKKGSDEIVKTSILFFQKKYFRREIYKIIIIIILSVFIGYFGLLCLGEVTCGSLNWVLFDTEYSMELPSFSSKIAKIKSEQFLRALKSYDYNTIKKLLIENPSRKKMNLESIAIDNYINNLKAIKKEGFKITDYKYKYTYFNNSVYLCEFDIVCEYDGIKYNMMTQLKSYGKNIVVEGLGYTSVDSSKMIFPIIKLEPKNGELYEKIENIFEY